MDLNGMKLAVDEDTIYFDPNIIVEGKSYAVMARQLVSETTDSFEGRWGDSSGIWGDVSFEDYDAFQSTFTLNNASGQIYLFNIDGFLVDSCIWAWPTADGFSWERDSLNFESFGWHECGNYSGSTPGKQNSVNPDGGANQFIINVIPRILSNRDDGTMQVEFGIPSGTRMTAYVCSEVGRRIFVIAERIENKTGILSWNGRGHSGSQLPPGIYIMVFDLSGRIDHKMQIPVVIAP